MIGNSGIREHIESNTISGSIGGEVDLEEVFLNQHKESLMKKNESMNKPIQYQ